MEGQMGVVYGCLLSRGWRRGGGNICIGNREVGWFDRSQHICSTQADGTRA